MWFYQVKVFAKKYMGFSRADKGAMWPWAAMVEDGVSAKAYRILLL